MPVIVAEADSAAGRLYRRVGLRWQRLWSKRLSPATEPEHWSRWLRASSQALLEGRSEVPTPKYV